MEEVFPEQNGARGMPMPLSDHLLIELRRGGVRPRAGLEQRPVAVRLDSSAVGKETAAAYAVVTTGSGFAEQLRLDAAAAQACGASDIASVTGTLRALGVQVAGEVQAARQESSAAAGKSGGGGSAHTNFNSWTKRLFEARRLRDAKEDPMAHTRNLLLFHPKTGLRKTLMQKCGSGRPWLEV